MPLPAAGLPATLRRSCTWLLLADLLLTALAILWALASARVPSSLRLAVPAAAAALAAASVPAWLGLATARRWAVILAAVPAALRALLGLLAISLVLIHSRLGSVLGLLACAQVILAVAAVPALMSADENRDALR